MTQMRVQITTPYGVTTHEFPEDQRDVVIAITGERLVTAGILVKLLDAAETFTHNGQTDPLIGYDASDEHDYMVAVVRTVLGRRSIELVQVSAQDAGMYEIADDAEFSEVDAYELDFLPFDVRVEDVTGQLYDEVKAGEA